MGYDRALAKRALCCTYDIKNTYGISFFETRPKDRRCGIRVDGDEKRDYTSFKGHYSVQRAVNWLIGSGTDDEAGGSGRKENPLVVD